MKACSFLPAITQMIYDMGLQETLYGITFECPQIALREKPPVVRYLLEGKEYTSDEIDTIFSASKAEGRSLYYVEENLLQEINPDIIFTQDVCEVCQIDTACTLEAVSKLAYQPEIVPITPQSLDDVFSSAILIAKKLNNESNGKQYVNLLKKRIDHVTERLRLNKAQLKKISLLEWMQPIYNCGHWIPYQVKHAGGIDMLSNPAGDSYRIGWEQIVRYDPEVLVIAPCGFSKERSMEEIHLMVQRPGWHEMTAIKNNRVFIVDFELFTQPSAEALTDGIELLAGLFHPEIIPVPPRLTNKFLSLKDIYESPLNA